MNIKDLSIELYNNYMDMDYNDYKEQEEQEIEQLEKELNILINNNCNYILNILKAI